MKRTTGQFIIDEGPNRDLIVLTNDPSITAWGWAVVDTANTILAAGCIKTAPEYKKRRIRKGDDTVRRVSEINQTLLRVIKHYKVSYLLTELPHGSQNASAAVMIGIVTGIVQTLSDALEIGVEWFAEQDAKKCVLGKNSASKQEMITAIDKLYRVKWKGVKYQDEAIADALAIHYTALKQSNVLQLFRTMQ